MRTTRFAMISIVAALASGCVVANDDGSSPSEDDAVGEVSRPLSLTEPSDDGEPLAFAPTLDGKSGAPPPLGNSGGVAKLEIGTTPALVLYDFIKSGGSLSLWSSDIDLLGRSWDSGGAVSNDTSSMFVPAGMEATVCTDRFLRGTCRRFYANTPGYVWPMNSYGLDQNVESVELRTRGGVDWSSYDYLGNYPNGRKNDVARDIQGVAHSSSHWFISNIDSIWRIPVTSEINAGSFPVLHIGDIPGNCGHIGDIDFYSGELFVPLEQCDGASFAGDDRIAVYHVSASGDFTFDRQLLLGMQSNASWVAVNPINGLMYSSDFDAAGDTVLRVYDRDFVDGTLIAGQKYRVFLPRHFSGVQGGTFDNKGNIYLSEHKSGDGAGIHAYRLYGGYGETIGYIGPNGFDPGFPKYEEIEGLDWWDLSLEDKDIPGIETGPGAAQLHWLLLGNEVGDADEFWFKHVRLD